MKYYTTDPGAKGASSAALRELADYLDRHPAIPVPKTGETVSCCMPAPPTTADAPRSTTSPGSSAPTSATRPLTAATTGPSATSAPSATRSSPSPNTARPLTGADAYCG